MRKIYFVAGLDFEEINKDLGVKKKIKAQIAAMNQSGMKCEYYYLPFTVDNSFITKIKRCLPFVNTHQHWGIDERLINADGLYIRRLGEIDGYVIDFFQKVRQRNPKLRIVWEFPTYPYDRELKYHFRTYPIFIKDWIGRKNLHRVVDRIATLTDDKEIFGIPTLRIDNGFDVSGSCPRNPKCEKDGVVHCIAVATMEFWHGYDRFIEGMHHYYVKGGGRDIVFHLVGDGPEIPKYRKLVSTYGLGNRVVFHGMQYGDALDDVYDQCVLGIGELGGYRKRLFESASLKSREYLAKGIPFITDSLIIGLVDTEGIYIQVPQDESPINIDDVLKFYDRVYQETPQAVISRLRDYARKQFSMEAAMREVITYFQSDKR